MTAPAYSFDRPTRPEWRRRFRSELSVALTRSGMTHRELADAVGVRRHQTVSEWVRGLDYPLVLHAPRIAEALDAPHLAELVIEGRTIECVICGKTTVAANKGSQKIYCGIRCKAAANDRRRRGAHVIDSHLTRNRLTEHQEAVAAFCRECTLGETLCPLWSCKLRPVSPLPLSEEARRAQAREEGVKP